MRRWHRCCVGTWHGPILEVPDKYGPHPEIVLVHVAYESIGCQGRLCLAEAFTPSGPYTCLRSFMPPLLCQKQKKCPHPQGRICPVSCLLLGSSCCPWLVYLRWWEAGRDPQHWVCTFGPSLLCPNDKTSKAAGCRGGRQNKTAYNVKFRVGYLRSQSRTWLKRLSSSSSSIWSQA